MSKSRVSSEWKKFLAILVVLLFLMTPLGKHAFVGASNLIAKKVAGSITQNLPKTPGATPSGSPSSSK